jgi:hypothetical protein
MVRGWDDEKGEIEKDGGERGEIGKGMRRGE